MMELSQTFCSLFPQSIRRNNLKNFCSKAFFSAVILYIFASTIFIIDKVSYDKRSKSYYTDKITDSKNPQPSTDWIPTYSKNKIIRNKNFSSHRSADGPRCGYQNCNLGKEDMLNVHLISHTHDDVGWTKSISDYYYDNVQFILDTVTSQLAEDAKKKFIYVEMAFFQPWWVTLSEERKKIVHQLVNSGQLEFILGGWSMNDEASTHYSAIIDQHTVGFEFLKNTFGECGIPKIGWQVDPFGHSREQASLFAQFGFDAAINSRIDWQDYAERRSEKNLEDMWYGSDSLEGGSPIYSHSLYRETYSHADEFCFECGIRIKDNPEMKDYNVDAFMDTFIRHVYEQRTHFKTNHIMVMMGGDFEYQNAKINFKNIDLIIKHIKKIQRKGGFGADINVFYSTPSCYVKAVNMAGLELKPYHSDYFPYSNREEFFWTGYYTSRPTLKLYERIANSVLQVCKQVHSLAQLHDQQNSIRKITKLKHAVGVLQHHDAITGTSKFRVAQSYALLTAEGINGCQDVIGLGVNKLMGMREHQLIFKHCPLLNVSVCDVSVQFNKFAVVVYNPLGIPVHKWMRIPVSSGDFKVFDHLNQSVPWQINSVLDSTKSLYAYQQQGEAELELIFRTSPPALGFTTYYVHVDDKGSTTPVKEIRFNKQPEISISNEYLKLVFDGTTGLLRSIHNLEKKIVIQATQNIMYYTPSEYSSSGAYVFHPSGPAKYLNTNVVSTVVRGDEVDEVRQRFNTGSSQVVRLYRGSRHFEVEWTVSTTKYSRTSEYGMELISRFKTSINNKGIFYTDANGRQIMKRRRHLRDTWKLHTDEKISSNYYPITNRIFIQDTEKNIQLNMMSDRSQGGSSLKDGQLELMIHRQLFQDDSLGVNEPLNDMESDGSSLIVRGTHYITLDTIEASMHAHRTMSQQLIYQPHVSLLPSHSADSLSENSVTQWSGLKVDRLPEKVHLLTLEQWHNNSLLIRLENYHERDRMSQDSESVSVSLRDLFEPFSVVSVVEQALGANQDIDKVNRLQWNVKGRDKTSSKINDHMEAVKGNNFEVVLKVMQIRTFIIQLSLHQI